MYISKHLKTKVYNHYDLNKCKLVLKETIDDPSVNNYIAELYEDTVDQLEKTLGKDIALTTNIIEFKNVCQSEIVVDVANYITLSAITYTDLITEAICTLTGSTIYTNENAFVIKFPYTIYASVMTVTFTSGYITGNIDKTIRRSINVLLNDNYDVNSSSYTLQNVKETKALERLNSLSKKHFFITKNNINIITNE
jgi:hypothetical protein